ncbi:MAG: transcriptional coactivator p15/PC4 family protein [Methanothrix sp.]|nr:transcriptional coactivator p15/PC4 family protein [Methanothrix sp.]
MAEIGRLRKNETTEIVVQKTEYRGAVGIDLREYVTSERYTGWSKNGIRIPVEQWPEFKTILDGVDLEEKEKRAGGPDRLASQQD